ncbi:MAG: NAD(P)-binding protein [Lewinellaceae bacterium]|nr:NAD(P)-binding protein [Lewinellaceae bacterium]
MNTATSKTAQTVAIIGAGPAGLVAARWLREVGFRPTLIEEDIDVGGQWRVGGPQSSVWPGMRTNTSRVMTAFSGLPHPPGTPAYPTAEQIGVYLRRYAEHAGVLADARFRTRVDEADPDPAGNGWVVRATQADGTVPGQSASTMWLLPPAGTAYRWYRRSWGYPASPAAAARPMPRYTAAPTRIAGSASWSPGTASARWRSPASWRCEERLASWSRRAGIATCSRKSCTGACLSSTSSTPATQRWRPNCSRRRRAPRTLKALILRTSTTRRSLARRVRRKIRSRRASPKTSSIWRS